MVFSRNITVPELYGPCYYIPEMYIITVRASQIPEFSRSGQLFSSIYFSQVPHPWRWLTEPLGSAGHHLENNVIRYSN